MGLTPVRHLVYIEEMERCGAPWMPDSGVRNLGPVLIQHGSPEQKAFWLPRILSGDQVWCQGYSEPGAGSDLPSLRTRGRVDGEELVIDGHKTWTTAAHDATHMFALVRTDAKASRQAGISFVLLDMRQLGVSVRPIRNIAGEDEFCEVFLDGARTPLSNVVGPLHQGWPVANSLLGFERVWAGSPRKALGALWQIHALARQCGWLMGPELQDKVARATLDVQDLQSLYQSFAAALRRGELGPEVSALKVWATETAQQVSELLIEIAADLGALPQADTPVGTSDVLGPFFGTRTPTIFSGSNQIQRNILAKQILNLAAAARS
jgi:alkylation response protein AidB-like acyl-CoA dehydrogenase